MSQPGGDDPHMPIPPSAEKRGSVPEATSIVLYVLVAALLAFVVLR
jgi:hypothetical protein